jgi:hypothetical protein
MSSRNPHITTPKGTAVFPKLNEPDRRFKAEGEYKVTLRLPDSEAKPLIAQLEKIRKEAYDAEAKKMGKKLKMAGVPYGPAMSWNADTEEKVPMPGFTDFKFSLKASVTTKTGKSWEQRPALFDSRLQPMPADSDPVGGGSIIRVNAEVYPWYTASLGFGISLRCRGVQVLELKTFGGERNGASFGFEQEDGYQAAPVPSGAEAFKDEGKDTDESPDF